MTYMKLVMLLALAILAPASVGLAQRLEESSCVSCHSDTWEEVKDSIHAKQGISCHHCHGGDPTQSDQALAKAPGSGYVGIPDKQHSVQTCGTCHADVEFMNFYSIRTDQFARYQASTHGKKLLEEGDARVAACIDCHGYHDVWPVNDSHSPVYPLNQPHTCNRCHGNQQLMAKYGLPTDIFDTYQASVHGQALLQGKDFSAAYCTSCHGSHGAVPPGVRDISATCGKCHINERKYFLESPHAHPMKEGKFSECISCHGHHDVQHAGESLYTHACIQCHAPDSPAVLEGGKIAGVLRASKETLAVGEALVKDAAIEGIFVEEESGALEEARTDAIAMVPLQHTLSFDQVSALADQLARVVEDVKAHIYTKRRHLRWRKIALIPIWMFVLTVISAFWIKHERLKSQREKRRR